ncbi:hypothetical protein NMG60_11022258 [Bertholletia excelsa]
MSSGFSGGGSDFYAAGGFNGRSMAMNTPQGTYRSQLSGILPDPAGQILHRRPDLIGKRSLAEFQSRTYQHASPISPLSPIDFSPSISPDVSSISSIRYGLPILQQLRPQPPAYGNGNSASSTGNTNLSGVSYPNMVQNRVVKQEICDQSESKMMNRLQELEKQLLDDNEEEEGDAVSVVTNSEWSDTIQNLITPAQKPISPSPTSSSSSCSSSTASAPAICPKQSLIDVATAISEGTTEVAAETLTRLSQVANVKGTAEQRMTAYMVPALRSRVNTTECPPPVAELFSKEHAASIQLLHEASPCFKLGLMAANLAILETTSDQQTQKLHVVDFDIGKGIQYEHLIQALASRKTDEIPSLKITTFADPLNGGEDGLKVVGDRLKVLANKRRVCLNFNVVRQKAIDLSRETLGIENDESLAVNLAFRLYKLPDESVTTENFRDELLRRVRGLSPAVVTMVEQEMNGNTAPFVARVSEACGYYGALFESIEATMLPCPGRDNQDRIRIEEGLGRKAANSVACEGRDRVERCEVFGKWRARMGMAGFRPNPLSQQIADSVRACLNSGTRGNPGFTVKEETGGICFGWMGRTLTVASAWR